MRWQPLKVLLGRTFCFFFSFWIPSESTVHGHRIFFVFEYLQNLNKQFFCHVSCKNIERFHEKLCIVYPEKLCVLFQFMHATCRVWPIFIFSLHRIIQISCLTGETINWCLFVCYLLIYIYIMFVCVLCDIMIYFLSYLQDILKKNQSIYS